jgi:hypothetical protein
VENYRKALTGEGRSPLNYKLRDKRYDKRVGSMTPEQVDRAVNAYQRRMETFHANTVARTATVDAQRLGNHLAWEDAVEQGFVDGQRLFKTWITVQDDRVRDEHAAMQGERVPWDAVFSNGEEVPGESTWNCRCVARFTVERAA